MTWFEAEQIAEYIHNLEFSLDEWKLTNVQMRQKILELDRYNSKLSIACSNCKKHLENPQFCQLVDDLLERIDSCSRNIKERLMA